MILNNILPIIICNILPRCPALWSNSFFTEPRYNFIAVVGHFTGNAPESETGGPQAWNFHRIHEQQKWVNDQRLGNSFFLQPDRNAVIIQEKQLHISLPDKEEPSLKVSFFVMSASKSQRKFQNIALIKIQISIVLVRADMMRK